MLRSKGQDPDMQKAGCTGTLRFLPFDPPVVLCWPFTIFFHVAMYDSLYLNLKTS